MEEKQKWKYTFGIHVCKVTCVCISYNAANIDTKIHLIISGVVSIGIVILCFIVSTLSTYQSAPQPTIFIYFHQ